MPKSKAKSKPVETFDRPCTTATGTPNGHGCEVVKRLLQPQWIQQDKEYVLSVAIPGLDATLCRCSECLKRDKAGVYWADTWMRERLQKRIYAYNFQNSGDLSRDTEDD